MLCIIARHRAPNVTLWSSIVEHMALLMQQATFWQEKAEMEAKQTMLEEAEKDERGKRQSKKLKCVSLS